MNIAIFTDLALPSIGGAETAIDNQCRALEDSGHVVTLVTPRHFNRSKSPNVIELRVLAVRYWRQWMYHSIPLPGDVRKIAAQLSKRKVDVIHVQTEFGAGLLGFRVARYMKLPVVYTSHTRLWEMVDRQSWWIRFGSHLYLALVGWYAPFKRVKMPRLESETTAAWSLRRHVCSAVVAADLATTPSSALAELYQQWTSSPKEIIVAPNFTDLKPTSTALPTTPMFVWVGRMELHKRPEVFAEAVRIVNQTTDKPFRAQMIGYGMLENQLRQRSKDLPLLDIIGKVEPSSVLKHLQASSILVVTSYKFDNQPMVIAEALAAGRGVVVCDPALREGVVEGAGIITPQPSAESLAEVLLGLVESPERVGELSKRAHSSAEIFGKTTGTKRLETIYQKALELKG